MGFIQKDWANPVSVNSAELNRIEKGIKDSHDNIKILSEELSNLQLKQVKNQQDIQSLISNSPSVLETLEKLTELVSNNESIIQTLQDTSNLVTQTQLNNSLNTFLHLTDIKQDGKSIVNGTEVNITTPTIDKVLNRVSENAISNKAVTQTLEKLTKSIIIPTKLADLSEDANHLLVTENEKALWNTIKEISFTETDPTVPNWAKQSSKPIYEWIEIKNKPTIHSRIIEFPDADNYALISHNHNNIYAQLNHEHDNRYAHIIHKHPEYALTTHNHDDKYASLNHTHNFDTSKIEQSIADEIATRSRQYKTLRDLIDSISMDYNDLQNLPDLTIYALASDLYEHNHDNVYALINHNHNNLYSTLDHSHSEYALKSHNHNSDYASIDHNHDTKYADINHNHNSIYSQLGHKHDLDYANINHNHDTKYSDINHNHDTKYSLTTHTHDYSSVYANINHTHSEYASSTHTHTEFSSIVDTNTIQTMIDTSISNLIDGAPETMNTLNELSNAISDNTDLISALNSAVSNHNHDTKYSALNHTHTVSNITDIATYYSSINHNHDAKYSDINHNHDTEYSDINHNHDTVYAPISHTHTKSNIEDFEHTHTSDDISDLTTILSGYATTSHSHNYLPLSGGTIKGTSGDTPLTVQSASQSTYIGFKNSSGSTLGYLGVNNNKRPVFYDSTSRELALKSDIPNVSQSTGTSTTDVMSQKATTDALAKKMDNFSISIGATNGGNPRPTLFVTVDYNNFTSESSAYFKLSATGCHGNGSSYAFLEDVIIGVNYAGTISCNVYKYVQKECGTYQGANRHYGDIFYVHDSTAKTVKFYILLGQYSSAQFTPATKIGLTRAISAANGITQHTGTPTYYSSGNIVWAIGNDTTYARLSDIPTDKLTEITTALSNKFTNHPQSAYNCDTCYDEGVYLIANGSNCPSGFQYGSLFVMPYRKPTGNTKPDFCTQIYIPNGDDQTDPNRMFYRTSLADSWNPWQKIALYSEVIRGTYDSATDTFTI